MIVICEQCDTRFKLDETRIPPGGARVRCSRCKHAFFLPTPAGDDRDLLDELVSQTAAEPSLAPPPSEDLEEPSEAAGRALPSSALESGPPGEAPRQRSEEEESDWQFSDGEPHAEEAADEELGLLDDHGDAAPSAEPDRQPTSEAPEEALSLVRDAEVARAPSAARPEEIPALEAPPAAPEPEAESESKLSWSFDAEEESSLFDTESESLAPAPAAGPAPALERPAVEPLESRAVPEEPVGRVSGAVGAVGWATTLLLFCWVLSQLLQPAVAVEAPLEARPAGALVAQALRGRFVDNLFAGPLFVVSAELVNSGPTPRAAGALLRVALVDEAGATIPGTTAALAPISERALREERPGVLAQRLSEQGTRLGTSRLAPGEVRSVVAVFPELPPGAVAFTLDDPIEVPATPDPEAGPDGQEIPSGEEETAQPD